MPRWALVIDFAYRLFLVAGACVVIALWWQAATRDEEADRNARIQSCSSGYAATYSAWDAEAQRLFGDLIAQAVDDHADPSTVDAYRQATANAAEMARRRIGLARFSAQSVKDGNAFACPALPGALMVEAVDP